VTAPDPDTDVRYVPTPDTPQMRAPWLMAYPLTSEQARRRLWLDLCDEFHTTPFEGTPPPWLAQPKRSA
jgi:hypothetical protein